MKISDIIEARRNPEYNPKQDLLSVVTKFIESGDSDNTYISFTGIEKLGINPQSTYNTPLGIYAYPIDYVYRALKSRKSAGEVLPFAGDQPWANIFQVEGNIINLDTMPESYLTELHKLAVRLLTGKVRNPELLITDIEERSQYEAKKPGKVGGRFWYITMKLAGKLVELEGKISSRSGDYEESVKYDARVARMWNWIFRQMAIDGFVDPGLSIIHSSEPTQAVFVSIQAIENNTRVANKYAPADVEASRQSGSESAKLISMYSNLSPDERIDFINRNSSSDTITNKTWRSIFSNSANSPIVRRHFIDMKHRMAAEFPMTNSEYVHLFTNKISSVFNVAAAVADGRVRQFPINAILEIVKTQPEYAAEALHAQEYFAKKLYPDSFVVEMLKLAPGAYYKIKKPTADMLRAAVIGAELKSTDSSLLPRARDSWISFHDSLYAKGQQLGIFPPD